MSEDSARLYLAVGRLWRTLRQDAREGVVGHGALSALATLVQDGPQRLGTLAQAEGVSAPAMTRIVGYLEKLGYVVRSPDPDDGRATVVAATDEGEAVLLQGRAARLQALHERFERLAPESREALVRAVDALEELSDEPGGSAGR
jgi:DNA-binding MarR family transcriptional regulator